VSGTVSRCTNINRKALVDVRRWGDVHPVQPPKKGSAHFGRVERNSEKDINTTTSEPSTSPA